MPPSASSANSESKKSLWSTVTAFQNARARIFSMIARILPTDGTNGDGFGNCGEPAQRLVEPRCAARGTGAGAGGSAGGDFRSRWHSRLQPGRRAVAAGARRRIEDAGARGGRDSVRHTRVQLLHSGRAEERD